MEPPVIGAGQAFEVDELHTFIGTKSTPVWIAYAMNKITKQVVTFNIGSRSNQMLSQVTEPLLKALPSRIQINYYSTKRLSPSYSLYKEVQYQSY